MLASRLRLPTMKRKLTIFSDGNKQNITGLSNNFPQGTLHYAMRKKIKRGDRIIGIVNEIIFGNPPRELISIHNIDGFCSALRERTKCSVRRAKTFAKKRSTISELLAIYQAYHNLIKIEAKKTPCMREGLTSKMWSWSDLFHQRLTYV